MDPRIHHRGNRWIGRLGNTFAWGRSFAECGVKLAGKRPELAAAIMDALPPEASPFGVLAVSDRPPAPPAGQPD